MTFATRAMASSGPYIASRRNLFLLSTALVFGATALTLSGCGNKDEATGKTLVTVNGDAIKESQLDAQLAQIPANLLQGREADVRRQILDNLVQQQLLSQEAKKENITDNADYKRQMALAATQLQATMVLANKVSETVTVDALRQAYDATKEQRAFPAVKAKHILVPTEQQALDIIKIATPANFSQLAKQYSKGPSADGGGDLGWFRREAMIPEFATVAFGTPVGTVAAQPVKTQFGWHVILVEARNDKYVPPFEQVEAQLRNEMAQTVAQGYLQDLRKKATVTFADDAVSGTTAVSGTAK